MYGGIKSGIKTLNGLIFVLGVGTQNNIADVVVASIAKFNVKKCRSQVIYNSAKLNSHLDRNLNGRFHALNSTNKTYALHL